MEPVKAEGATLQDLRHELGNRLQSVNCTGYLMEQALKDEDIEEAKRLLAALRGDVSNALKISKQMRVR